MYFGRGVVCFGRGLMTFGRGMMYFGRRCAKGHLVSEERREEAVLVSLLTKSLLHNERRPFLRVVLVCVNTLKIGDANTCNNNGTVCTHIVTHAAISDALVMAQKTWSAQCNVEECVLAWCQCCVLVFVTDRLVSGACGDKTVDIDERALPW